MEENWINELVNKSLVFYLPYRGAEISFYVKERPIREVFKAVQDAPPITDVENLREMVCGTVYKTFERLLERKESERGARIKLRDKELLTAVEDFVNLFWDKVFNEICEGRIANARRYQNQVVDGYTFKLLSRLDKEWEEEPKYKEEVN
ncbi:MAG: hypothetical protein QMC77_08220 [Methanocellales archaeon]|nr:hypothetical protein [Methanocellales archaeon]